MAACAIAVDGVLLPGPASRAAFFSQAPRGAYTALRLPRPFIAADWNLHVTRLEESLALLQSASAGALPAGQWLRPGAIQEAARETAHVAITALDAVRMQTEPVMLCLLVASGVRGSGAPAAPMPEQPPPPTTTCPSNRPFSMWALAVLMQHDAFNATAPSFATVVGPPRMLPACKDSAWVAGRRELEARLPAGAADGLLRAGDGALLEGMVTNLFVIREVDAHNGTEARGPWPSTCVLQTAAAAEGVLEGVARRRVLEAARRMGMTVEESAPRPEERGSWREAFLTNSIRGCQPLTRLEGGMLQGWSTELPGPFPGLWTAKLQAEIDRGTELVNLVEETVGDA